MEDQLVDDLEDPPFFPTSDSEPETTLSSRLRRAPSDMEDQLVDDLEDPPFFPTSDSEPEDLDYRIARGGNRHDIDHEEIKKQPLSEQVLMREAAWERRRRQTSGEGEQGEVVVGRRSLALTDDDLEELKGSIELGFGFNEEEGLELCETLPALDLYFAVNRKLSDPVIRASPSPGTTPRRSSAASLGDLTSTVGSPRTPSGGDPWKICSPGDNPKEVKTRLRHWAQAVACSVRQFSPC